MMNNNKVFIVGGNIYKRYVNWVIPLGFDLTDQLSLADLVFFCGGEDVFPGLYNHPVHPTTTYNWNRDRYELEIFKQSVKLKKKIWGCCRGSQAICAFQPGGYLIQDSNHPSYHWGINEKGEKLWLTSSHHQMVMPHKLNHRILVYADNLASYKYLGDGTNIKLRKEPEMTYYPDIAAVGSQSHVEWQYGEVDIESQKTVKYHQDILIKLLNNNL